MSEPSIKGTALSSVIDDVRGLLENGRLTRNELETLLQAQDLELLEEKILPGLWYPIESYRRLSELLLDMEGRGDPRYIVERGARAAERIFESGVYAQLRKGAEIAAEARQTGGSWAERDGQLIATLAGAIFNFGQWKFTSVPDRENVYRIDVLDAAAFPDVARLAAQGFIEYTASRLSGSTAEVTSERSSDVVAYSILSAFDR